MCADCGFALVCQLFRPACLGDRNTGSFLLASVSNPSGPQAVCAAVSHLRTFYLCGDATLSEGQ